jgi:hypothetical protein
MQIDMANLTPEAHQAIVECLKIAARRGRQLREARERAKEVTSAGTLGSNILDETDKHLPPESQSQQANDDQ